jgi:hypothetical protein
MLPAADSDEPTLSEIEPLARLDEEPDAMSTLPLEAAVLAAEATTTAPDEPSELTPLRNETEPLVRSDDPLANCIEAPAPEPLAPTEMLTARAEPLSALPVASEMPPLEPLSTDPLMILTSPLSLFASGVDNDALPEEVAPLPACKTKSPPRSWLSPPRTEVRAPVALRPLVGPA